MADAPIALPRPAAGDYDPASSEYLASAPVIGDAVLQLTSQRDSVRSRLAQVSPDKAGYRYGPDKWTVREVAGHLADAERVLSYRLLRIGRGDATPLPGFDENIYVPAARFERRPLAAVTDEWAAVRDATIALVRGLPADAWTRRGTANGKSVTTAALVYIIHGHVEHHLKLLNERYGVAC
ncbi:MAG: hypothetical protein A3H29_14325 [Acidobacteria bacterium RIFCSPLOWO2_02_FULL_67_21]|nr:MAG: hypothetical protein A3H29_14325 [Acidobacteria bacterium RIFCSPLOWO2_02_FULL_67_21]